MVEGKVLPMEKKGLTLMVRKEALTLAEQKGACWCLEMFLKYLLSFVDSCIEEVGLKVILND